MDRNTVIDRPSWLRVRAPTGPNYLKLQRLIQSKRLHTVCSSASCPNIGECWELGTATFMIMGNICTRACRFCHVDSSSRPAPLDLDEPERLANTVVQMGLKHVVITSVARDDLPDGGASHFAKCINAVRSLSPNASIEVLVPDFKGKEQDIATVLATKPEVFNHNIETIKRLTSKVRSKATYDRSLSVLKYAKELSPHVYTKSGIMLGLGETNDEVKESIIDLFKARISILTIGQYLRPSAWHHQLVRFATPGEFAELKIFAKDLGITHVESGPLVRSSYHAERAIAS